MIKAILIFCLGLLFLIKGGDWFVDGATGIARKFHVPELLIGATVVSIGTTLPEVMVSSQAALIGQGDVAYGNAIGSIICNTALISAITIAIKPSIVDKQTLRKPVIFFFISMAFYAGVAYFYGQYTRTIGIILLAIFVVYMIVNIKDAFADKNKTLVNSDNEEVEEEIKTSKAILLLVVGAVLIAFGARFLVDNGIIIAKAVGVPSSVIALTFVALGTSLPELVTAITALVKGHSALSLGNIIGANIFNLVLVSGLSITLSPFNLPVEKTIAGMNASLVVDIPVAIIVMILLTIPALIKGKLSRGVGIILLCIYTAFVAFQFFA